MWENAIISRTRANLCAAAVELLAAWPSEGNWHEVESETQIAAKAEYDGSVCIRNTAIDDLQIGRELKPGRDRDVVEKLHARSVVGIEEGA